MSLVEDLQKQQQEVDRRLAKALEDVGRSALGMPSAADTFRAMLDRAGLALMLKAKPEEPQR